MKRFFTISLLLLYINSNTELHEFLRLPVLFEHFTEHKSKVDDISFWQFLTLHYNTNASHDADDNKLPFKDPAHSFTAFVLVLPTTKISIEENRFSPHVAHTCFYQEAFFDSPLSEIFQPPKI